MLQPLPAWGRISQGQRAVGTSFCPLCSCQHKPQAHRKSQQLATHLTERKRVSVDPGPSNFSHSSCLSRYDYSQGLSSEPWNAWWSLMSKEGLPSSQGSQQGVGSLRRKSSPSLGASGQQMGDPPWLRASTVPSLQVLRHKHSSLFHVILCEGKNNPSEQLPGHLLRRKSVPKARHFVKIGTNRISHVWSCHSMESHSCKQQGPHGFDGNTNTTCDSIKEAVIKKGEQHAVSPILSSLWGLVPLISRTQYD